MSHEKDTVIKLVSSLVTPRWWKIPFQTIVKDGRWHHLISELNEQNFSVFVFDQNIYFYFIILFLLVYFLFSNSPQELLKWKLQASLVNNHNLKWTSEDCLANTNINFHSLHKVKILKSLSRWGLNFGWNRCSKVECNHGRVKPCIISRVHPQP